MKIDSEKKENVLSISTGPLLDLMVPKAFNIPEHKFEVIVKDVTDRIVYNRINE